MEIEEKYKKNVKILNNENISEDSLEKLVENCCKVLSGQKETLDIATLSQLPILEIKRLQASLLYIYPQFVRHSQSNEEFLNFLLTDCSVEGGKAKILADHYAKWFKDIRIQLLNIGSHLPHITDVRWKIDYVVKSNSLDQSEGPVFRVSLKTEQFDRTLQGPRTEYIDFTCNSQELQDLVYKLKDAVRHCQKLASGH